MRITSDIYVKLRYICRKSLGFFFIFFVFFLKGPFSTLADLVFFLFFFFDKTKKTQLIYSAAQRLENSKDKKRV